MSSSLFYTQEGNNYTVKENKIFPIIGLLFFIGMMIVLFMEAEQVNGISYWVFLLLPSCLFLYQVGRKVHINTLTKTLEVSFFGIRL